MDESRNQLRIQMAGPGRAEEAQRAIVEALGDRSLGRLEPVAIVADYTFAELKKWYDDAAPQVMALEGVTLGDIDEKANRLLFGLDDAAWRPTVESELVEAGVPLEAVNMREVPPATLETTVRDFHRPVVGGLQISFFRGTDTPICSMGFNALRNAVRSFVTASHCSATRSSNDGTVYYQPLVTAASIGSKWVDPPFFTGTPCPSGRRCRYSDSLVGTYGDLATSTNGVIARTALDSYLWNGSDVYRVTSEEAPVVGRTVNKLGRSTGRTRGDITNVCVQRDVPGTDITLLCQSLASYSSTDGDSGGPVFRITNSPNTNDVALVGLHWGGGGQFSPIGGIQRSDELGPLNTCASGFSC
ncbi:MAG TPA: hypothetical protein VHI71_09125 [Actinomycetota bacterium]|nr:hypothetical protein [Actinomycetota bacterium]